MADPAASLEPAPEQAVPTSDAEVDQQALLTQKTAQASHLYAHKSYEAAAELYAEAAELQAELNGELALENADLLYAYGRCLYHVAVSKSDVLGGKVAGEKTRNKDDAKKRGVKRKKGELNGAPEEQAPEEPHASSKTKDKAEPTNTPYFQIEGDDEDWSSASEDDDEDETAEAEGGGEQAANGADDPDGTAADEEDDFATAYEILDIARVLLRRKLEAAQREQDASTSSSAQPPDAAALRAIKESLADTHDLQSEISLESERFEAAVSDAQASLALKQELYPQDSNYVAEAHFKLSLALEFASVTQVKDEGQGAPAAAAAGEPSKADRNAGVAGVDEEMRKQAGVHMEASIASTRMRLEREKAALAGMQASEERSKKEKEVLDVTGMVEEMEQRLADLKQPAISVKGLGLDDAEDPVKGLLGSILGESKAAQRAAIEEATKGANDLTGLVKRKGKAKAEQSDGAAVVAVENGNENGDGKRKAYEMTGANGQGNGPETKKAKVEDATDG